MSLWENEDDARERLLQRILIGVGAAIAIAVVIWIMRNAVALMNRPRNGIGFASSERERRLMDGMESSGTPPAQSGQMRRAGAISPGSPMNRSYRPSLGISSAASRAYAAPVVPPPPTVVPLLSPAERGEAQMALAPLQNTLAAIKNFDHQSFWNGAPSAPVPHRAVHPGTGTASAVEDTAAAPGSTQTVDDATDALGALVGLYGHPDRFPAPVRSDVGVATTAMRGYLRVTNEASITSDPSDRQRMRAAAEKRLSESDAAIQRIQSAINGGTGTYVNGVAR